MPQTINSSDGSQLDASVVNLAKAIRTRESKGNYNAVGDAGTSKGAYQWQPGNFEAAASQYGLDPKDFSPVNQDKVAYHQVKALKDKGYTPEQVAAVWNAGEGHANDWQNHRGTTTINGQQIAYDTPAYVSSVVQEFQKLKGAPAPTTPSAPTSKEAGQVEDPTAHKGFLETVGSDLSKRAGQANDAINNGVAHKINPLSSGLQTLGAGAGAIGDVVGDALGAITPDAIKKPLEAGVQKIAGAAANTGVGRAAIQGGSAFASQHPELSADLGALGNLATLIPGGKAVGLAKDAIGAGVGKALGKTALDATIDSVSPILTAGKLDKSIAKKGLVTSGIRGTITPEIDEGVKKVAKAVSESVPDFDKLPTFADKLNATREAAYQMADDLKAKVEQSGKDIIFPQKELAAQLKAVEVPWAIKSDTTLMNQLNMARSAAMKISQENGGTVSSLFQTAKDFDRLVEKQFPNLYDRANAPMRDAIRSTRDAINEFIEQKLPPGNKFREERFKQSLLWRAVDNMAPKARKEVGTTKLGRFTKKHPLLTKGVTHAASGLLGGLGFAEGQNLFK